jgi:DNA polymerase-3 subunit delta
MDAPKFIESLPKAEIQPVYVLFGEEDFLKRAARTALDPKLLEDADPSFALSSYPGDKAEWSTIRSELATLPFLSPRRVVVIEQADKFVTDHRADLEKYVAVPSKGVLILDVKTWMATTKLAKAVPDAATIACKPIPPGQVPRWCTQHAQTVYGKKLIGTAGQLLIEFVGPSLGLLDQELAKLSAFVGERKTIGAEDVETLVGRSRAAETFKIFDAIGQGRAADALAILHRLLDQGEQPLAILGAFSWQLRRTAQAARLTKRGLSVSQALAEVGVRDFGMAGVEQLMRHLGMRRLEKLFDWLLEVDLGMKGGNPLPDSVQLERFVVRLAQPRDPVPKR